MKVAVLGAGINGLSCAVKIKEKYPNIDVPKTSKGKLGVIEEGDQEFTAEQTLVLYKAQVLPHTTALICGKDQCNISFYLTANGEEPFGLSRIQCNVVIISDILTPTTTSDGCGGLWKPYFCGNTHEHLLTKWGIETYQLYHKLWLEGGYDVSMMPLYDLFREATPLTAPEWSNSVFGFKILDKKHMDYLCELHSNKYAAGLTFTTFIVWSKAMLAHLTERFKLANGRLMKGTVKSLSDPELKEYDVIVNCLGLGARDVVPDDKVYPVRGQILGIEAPWLNETIFDINKGIYILPNSNRVIIGGTHQENNFNTEVNDEDTDTIANGSSGIVPGIKNAKVLSKWAGLRPCREEIRLEQEEINGKFYIHNYGHGGSGLTFFWGCASDVLEIFDKHVNTKKIKEISKL